MFAEVALSILALFAARVLWRRWRYDLHKIPSPPGLPLVGHTLDLLKGRGDYELTRYIGNSWKALGEPKLIKINIGGTDIIYVRSMDCAKNVIMSKTAPFPKNSFVKTYMSPIIGNDMSITPMVSTPTLTPYVKAVRKMYATGLQSKSLKAAMPKLRKVFDKVADIIERKREEGPVEFQELCIRMTLDVIGVLAFDTELGGLDNSRQIHRLIREASDISTTRSYNVIQTLLHKLFPSMKGAKEEERALEQLTAEWDRLTTDILARDDPPEGEEPLWHSLRSMTDPETGRRIEYKKLRAEVATIVMTGRDTTGYQLSCILAQLASNPEVVEGLIGELKTHNLFGPKCRCVEYEDLTDLPYLCAVVKEGLRIAHVLTCTFNRAVPRDMEILGYRIQKGTTVTVIGNRWANSESEWKDPRVFRPERWLVAEDLSQKYYLPFSCGPRDCIGQKLAILELRVAVVHFIQRYTLTPTSPAEELLKDTLSGAVLSSAKGVWIHVSPRKHHVHA